MVSRQVFDLSLLTNPHMAVGNGQHLVCASLALLAALVSIELFAEPSPLACIMPTADNDVEINPSADGRCFFSCLYLHSASTDEKKIWANTERNAQGFPIESSRQKTEARFEQILVVGDLGVVVFIASRVSAVYIVVYTIYLFIFAIYL